MKKLAFFMAILFSLAIPFSALQSAGAWYEEEEPKQTHTITYKVKNAEKTPPRIHIPMDIKEGHILNVEYPDGY